MKFHEIFHCNGFSCSEIRRRATEPAGDRPMTIDTMRKAILRDIAALLRRAQALTVGWTPEERASRTIYVIQSIRDRRGRHLFRLVIPFSYQELLFELTLYAGVRGSEHPHGKVTTEYAFQRGDQFSDTQHSDTREQSMKIAIEAGKPIVFHPGPYDTSAIAKAVDEMRATDCHAQ
jgi:hypothetical protein